MTAPDLPAGTRVRKISATPGQIPVGTVGTIVDGGTLNGVPVYTVKYDTWPGWPVITPAARIEPIASARRHP